MQSKVNFVQFLIAIKRGCGPSDFLYAFIHRTVLSPALPLSLALSVCVVLTLHLLFNYLLFTYAAACDTQPYRLLAVRLYMRVPRGVAWRGGAGLGPSDYEIEIRVRIELAVIGNWQHAGSLRVKVCGDVLLVETFLSVFLSIYICSVRHLPYTI